MESIQNHQSFDSQVSRSCSSFSLPSEPPDVGNWFSSYEYKSPAPDSNVNYEYSDLRGCESEKDEETEVEKDKLTADEVIAGKNLIESTTYAEDKHRGQSLAKSLDAFSPSSLLSEPPDIRNWFSSYVYESSVSDTSSLYKESVPQEAECEKEGFASEESNENEVRCENVQTKGSVQHNITSENNMVVEQPSSRSDDSVEMKANACTASASHLKRILEPCTRDRILKHIIRPTKYEQTLSLSNGNPECNREETQISLDRNRSSCYSSVRTTELIYTKDSGEAKIQHENLDNGASLANRFSARNLISSGDKENEGGMESMNGFIATGKKRFLGIKDENSWKRPHERVLETTTSTGTVSIANEKHVTIKRKALAEATNYQQYNGMEVTGKWQCPQKGKTNTGPVLKQLRLERWVYRI